MNDYLNAPDTATAAQVAEKPKQKQSELLNDAEKIKKEYFTKAYATSDEAPTHYKAEFLSKNKRQKLEGQRAWNEYASNKIDEILSGDTLNLSAYKGEFNPPLTSGDEPLNNKIIPKTANESQGRIFGENPKSRADWEIFKEFFYQKYPEQEKFLRKLFDKEEKDFFKLSIDDKSITAADLMHEAEFRAMHKLQEFGIDDDIIQRGVLSGNAEPSAKAEFDEFLAKNGYEKRINKRIKSLNSSENLAKSQATNAQEPKTLHPALQDIKSYYESELKSINEDIKDFQTKLLKEKAKKGSNKDDIEFISKRLATLAQYRTHYKKELKKLEKIEPFLQNAKKQLDEFAKNPNAQGLKAIYKLKNKLLGVERDLNYVPTEKDRARLTMLNEVVDMLEIAYNSIHTAKAKSSSKTSRPTSLNAYTSLFRLCR